MPYAIEINMLSKRFKNHVVLKEICVEFEEGMIHGIVGRNGSGKTMLFKCILGLMPFSEGEIRVRSLRIGKDISVPNDVGMIIEGPGFLPNYSGFANLKLLSMIKRTIHNERIKQVIEEVGLNPENRLWVNKYSMGMRQRLCIAQAIMEDPSILVLDEPMNGLDNRGVEDIRTLLLNLKAQGKTILLASHNRDDIRQLCDSVSEIDNGILKKVMV